VSDTDFLSIAELGAAYRQKSLSPVEATRSAFTRIRAIDGQLNAFITLLEHEALAQAQNAERELKSGTDRGPLHGVPVAIKDLIAIAGAPTTYASRAASPRTPRKDAALIRKLKQAGAVLIGKTNLLEYAYGAVHPDFGQTNNPWDPKRTSGGSSGGSAAGVAAGCCFGAVGTDTGGSIRIPAAYCGVVGLKPSFGLVDLKGVQALSWSLDHAGPLARRVADAARLLEGMTGTSFPAEAHRLTGLQLGVMAHPGEGRFIEPGVKELFQAALAKFEEAGAEIRAVSIPDLERAGDALLSILGPEASVIHQRLIAAEPEGFGETTRLQIEAGFAIPATAYVRAQKLQRELARRYQRLFGEVDAILSPSVPWVAPAQDPVLGEEGGDGEMLYSAAYNLTGLPALSIFCGLGPENLPVGLQIVAPWGGDDLALSIGAAFEALLPPQNPSIEVS
jgi:aspartyl-tRNA(Asn)/glutamyl-tRNA(Gln) amidotransferase subunit A